VPTPPMFPPRMSILTGDAIMMVTKVRCGVVEEDDSVDS